MKTIVPEKLEAGRVREGGYATTSVAGMVGAFMVTGPAGRELAIISSGPDKEYGWEHVSVSLRNKTPTWVEMCFVKDLFWDEEEVVMQLHPAKSEYVNYHPHCLHLWRPMNVDIPTPHAILVGPKA
jgi:hypothetical protein